MFVVALIMLVSLVPTYSNGADMEIQIVHNQKEDYIIYVKELANKEFDFAISKNADTKEIDLNYTKSVKDEEGNQVVLISKEKYNEIQKDEKTYLYIKTNEDVRIKEIDLKIAFEQSDMEEVEKTTTRIQTEIVTNLVERNEEVSGVKLKVTVGGLKILDDTNSNFYYASTKLPAEKYTQLSELANRINTEYKNMNMYTKIETTKQFYNLYKELQQNQNWIKVENGTIKQPNQAQKDEQYVVFLKKIDENSKETIDMKIMKSYREDEEEKIPARTETKVVKETAKLPITGDNIVLFIILAIAIVIAIIVFIRIKKLQKEKADK